MPIICGGVKCGLAYLPGSGGLGCGVNRKPVLMMSCCPEGRWDRGFAVFAKNKSMALDKKKEKRK